MQNRVRKLQRQVSSAKMHRFWAVLRRIAWRLEWHVVATPPSFIRATRVAKLLLRGTIKRHHDTRRWRHRAVIGPRMGRHNVHFHLTWGVKSAHSK